MTKKIDIEPITIVLPMRNAATTVLLSLQSISKQKYPIKEVIVIDNASSDNSISLVEEFSKNSKIPIKLITRKRNESLGSSFNEGVKNSKSEFVILMHSDCVLPTGEEVAKLVEPIRLNKDVVATFSTILLLKSVWETYDFWIKYYLARAVGKEIAGLTSKFDCIRKDVYQKIGGFDVPNFGMGSEDADLHQRLIKVGKVTKSKARVIHLHYLGQGYSFGKLLVKQKTVGRGCGRLLRMGRISFVNNGLILMVKPSLAILPFIPYFHIFGLILIVMYSFLYTKSMFMSTSALKNLRILALPFVNVFFLYYETFWIIEAFLFGKNKIE
ncbi:MAG: glycosyltransferase family A protein [Candidatus Parcubacteria bacterium]|nr:glycosyltransferase family A protein [Candidatus Parcubacteria bacterium]